MTFGADPYKHDLMGLKFHLHDTGHFTLEEFADVIAAQMLEFLGRKVPRY